MSTDTQLNRAQFVVSASHAFFVTMQGAMGLSEIEDFAQKVEARAHAASQNATKEIGGDERRLTDHAANMRSISAHIIFLRDGCVPALKIDKESPTIRSHAISAVAYIHASLQALEMDMY